MTLQMPRPPPARHRPCHRASGNSYVKCEGEGSQGTRHFVLRGGGAWGHFCHGGHTSMTGAETTDFPRIICLLIDVRVRPRRVRPSDRDDGVKQASERAPLCPLWARNSSRRHRPADRLLIVPLFLSFPPSFFFSRSERESYPLLHCNVLPPLSSPLLRSFSPRPFLPLRRLHGVPLAVRCGSRSGLMKICHRGEKGRPLVHS